RIGKEAGVTAGVVHDKLYLPGLVKLRRLVDEGFFGRILSIRGEFGYWVFEGDVQAAQRPSWNYRKEDGGGMTTDMFCHWNYVLEGIIGKVKSVNAKTATHIPARRPSRQLDRVTIAKSAPGLITANTVIVITATNSCMIFSHPFSLLLPPHSPSLPPQRTGDLFRPSNIDPTRFGTGPRSAALRTL
ncbi:Gfo/Idh/MocA family protein, partial [Pandoraea pnomenusa]|uniref:Gfo/Idh/MocA family protein n=1 Tax=Pandoraea pnomenusa TaxID=93220 RepID=UPI001AC3E42F|nr:hypothetical protein [Pandoraea pnomenusa]